MLAINVTQMERKMTNYLKMTLLLDPSFILSYYRGKQNITVARVNRNFNFLSFFINPHKSPSKSGIFKVRKSKLLTTIIRQINRFLIFVLLFVLSICYGQTYETVSGQGKVTYLTADQVYCDIGTSQGIVVGDTLQIFRRTEVLGDLVISHSAKNSSVCTPLIPMENIQMGDRVQFEKRIEIITELPSETKIEEAPKEKKEKLNLKHSGNVSVRSTFQSLPGDVKDQTGIGTLQYGLTIPKYKSMKISIYGRSDMASKSFTLYQARASFGKKNKGTFLQLGRVFASELSGIGATDGLFLSRPFSKQISLGGLAGFQPDPKSYQLNLDIKKIGIFTKFKIPIKKLSGNIAFVGQYAGSEIDREFIYSKLSYSPLKQISIQAYQTVDLYRNVSLYNRKNAEATFTQLSMRFKINKNISFRSRFTSRQEIIYQQSQTLVPDSLFQAELKNGWYNSLKLRGNTWGTIQVGANIRKQSESDQFSSVLSLYYRTLSSKRGISLDWNSILIQNTLLTGIQNKFGFSMPFWKNGFFNAEYELYAFGFGQNWNEYFQHTLSGSLSKKMGKKFHAYASLDISLDTEFTRTFAYLGLSYRF
jgi:hypothetical protein